MVASLLKSIFGSANDRIVSKYRKQVEKINALEESISKLSDEQLKGKTAYFRDQLQQGKKLDDLLVEAFAVVREASKRVLGLRPFDVQLIGGMTLHHGQVAEMKTGEGKTLTATLPVYLNALSGKGVHVVTVNDYLASRDAKWMSGIYEFLGLSVGIIVHGLSDEARQAAYNSDVVYGTNHEFGFDYLRDNMKFHKKDMVMRRFNYAIVDEADSILIDEARTPLIISGPSEGSSDLYKKINDVIPLLQEGDYEKDEKQKNALLKDSGVERIEKVLMEQDIIKGTGLYDVQNIGVVHHINAALRAHKMYVKDVDYMIQGGEVLIIDEFTGRAMEGRRYSDGLHQAIEAKEGVEVQMENQTLASITYQNYFRLYPKLSGMSGTAMTEADELEEIYNLYPVEIPSNKPVARKDHDDEVYLTAREKYDAVLKLILEARSRMQPMLVGTTSIEKSEYLSMLLKKEKIPHEVLNAKYHEREAEIVANAGRPGSITIATNMAGRGTDIKLGGNLDMRLKTELKTLDVDSDAYRKAKARIESEIASDFETVKEAGGLYVIGTERHESRRIDNQLRGRSGRQGDPGASKFFVSLEDDLMRIFGSEKLQIMLKRLGVEEGEAITHKWVTKALERAQKKVETRNFDIRKHLLKYDDVMNDQRKVIYEQRLDIMDAESIHGTVQDMVDDLADELVQGHIAAGSLTEQWDIDGLSMNIKQLFGLDLPIQKWSEEDRISDVQIRERLIDAIMDLLDEKQKKYGEEIFNSVEKTLLLRQMDQVWKEHLLTLDHLREGINLRAYAQGNPLNEYKREAFNLFSEMLGRLRAEYLSALSHFEIDAEQAPMVLEHLLSDMDLGDMQEEMPSWLEDASQSQSAPPESLGTLPKQSRKAAQDVDPKDESTWGRVQRNALCPCGSGKKYKHCHGTL